MTHADKRDAALDKARQWLELCDRPIGPEAMKARAMVALGHIKYAEMENRLAHREVK